MFLKNLLRKKKSLPERLVDTVSHAVEDGRKKARPDKVVTTVTDAVDEGKLSAARRVGKAASVVAATVGASAVINAVRSGDGSEGNGR